jgi:hypothetical protein
MPGWWILHFSAPYFAFYGLEAAFFRPFREPQLWLRFLAREV